MRRFAMPAMRTTLAPTTLGAIHLDEANATLHFSGNDLWAQAFGVDLRQLSPPPGRSIQDIQQHDQRLAQMMMGESRAQNRARQKGTVPGAPAC
jgi:hypothetical protein